MGAFIFIKSRIKEGKNSFFRKNLSLKEKSGFEKLRVPTPMSKYQLVNET